MSKLRIALLGFGLVLTVAVPTLAQDVKAPNTSHYGWHEPAKILYVWAAIRPVWPRTFLLSSTLTKTPMTMGR
jgi:hypothetical protein